MEIVLDPVVDEMVEPFVESTVDEVVEPIVESTIDEVVELFIEPVFEEMVEPVVELMVIHYADPDTTFEDVLQIAIQATTAAQVVSRHLLLWWSLLLQSL
ncbi:unnamed protein product [Linum trigynum]|uniref:Uncharacterized protein n=1 Tax=Linum trigynum TaxID=586398 RepID=A0AAV2FP65_9ROSI